MRTYRDAKAMAKALRLALKQRDIELPHSDCLELVARTFGLPDWNTLSARIADESDRSLSLPQGWIRSGSKPDHYDMGVDRAQPEVMATIRCRFAADDAAYALTEQGFGTLMQSVMADDFRGTTLRLAAELKAERVSGAGTIWMRIERAPGQILRFDNMEDRPKVGALRDTLGWIEREIILDVPEDAASIHYGFYLRGTGALHARNFIVEEADPKAVLTVRTRTYLDRPTNLGFSPS